LRPLSFARFEPRARAGPAQVAAELVERFKLDGLLCDAEAGESFFQGSAEEASAYAMELRGLLDPLGAGVALCSHDIPRNFPDFPFGSFAAHCVQSAPQVYYGGSPSVERRLERALAANASTPLPIIPVGAAWIGDNGGCASASACAERAREFIRLAKAHQFPGYSFWHWMGAPAKFWEVLFETEA
jgi:hypothetical protein